MTKGALLDRTHDAKASSWIASANGHPSFPIQNLPIGVFRRRGESEPFRGGVPIGHSVVDLGAALDRGCFPASATEVFAAAAQPSLNTFMSLGPHAWQTMRHALFDALHTTASADLQAKLSECLVPAENVENDLPAVIGDYTDFYSSLHHALNIGRLFGVEKPSPNFYTLPIAYHGRVSTIGVSGGEVIRPCGQIAQPDRSGVVYAPTRKLDFELELGIFVGPGNAQGVVLDVAEAETRMFGMCLLNDWSARDIQAWEMHPLGPFNAKNFATTISPWIVSMAALAPFRTGKAADSNQPELPPYLRERDDALGAIDITVEAWIIPRRQDRGRGEAVRLSGTSFRHQYWTAGQMVAHHTSGGCMLRPGDLIGTGTISGPTAQEAGAMMELAQDGRRPAPVSKTETRSYLEDGDELMLTGHCQLEGFATIGFGVCTGRISPALGAASQDDSQARLQDETRPATDVARVRKQPHAGI